MKDGFRLLAIVLFCTVAFSQEKHSKETAALTSQPACTVPSDETAITQIAEAWREEYNNGKAAEVASLYTKDAYYLTQHFVSGIVRGRNKIKAYVQRGIDAAYHIDAIQVISTDCSGDLAYTVARYEATNAGRKVVGVNLVVLKRIEGKWFIVAHEAAVPDPGTASQQLDVSGLH